MPGRTLSWSLVALFRSSFSADAACGWAVAAMDRSGLTACSIRIASSKGNIHETNFLDVRFIVPPAYLCDLKPLVLLTLRRGWKPRPFKAGFTRKCRADGSYKPHDQWPA